MKLSVILLILSSFYHQRAVAVGGDQRIVGDDLLNRYTVRIMLLTKNSGEIVSGYCSGTLISADKVLTAAHCVDGNIWRARVLVGFDNPVGSDNQGFSTVSEGMSYVAHAGYLHHKTKRSFKIIWSKLFFGQPQVELADLAVIKLAENIDLPYPIEFVIPEMSTDLSGKQVTIAGYGIGDFGQQPGLARRAEVRLSRDYQQSDLLEFTNYFNSISPGDSGGPVWRHDSDGQLQLIGVHSLLFSYLRYYSWSIDVRHHRSWFEGAKQLLDNPQTVIKKGTDLYFGYFPGYLEDHHQATYGLSRNAVSD